MIVIYFLIPLSIVIAGGFLIAFIWAVKSGQFEDTCTPALRVLAEKPDSKKTGESNISAQEDKKR